MANASKSRSPSASTTVVRSASTGRLLIGGRDERQLVNKHNSIAVKAAPAKPKHLTPTEIKTLTRRMKVA